MQIEEPDWWDILNSAHVNNRSVKHELSQWFDLVVRPVNEILDEAQEVYGRLGDEKWFTLLGIDDDSYMSHKALLINIDPINHDTYESLLRDLIDRLNKGKDIGDIVERSEKALEVKC